MRWWPVVSLSIGVGTLFSCGEPGPKKQSTPPLPAGDANTADGGDNATGGDKQFPGDDAVAPTVDWAILQFPASHSGETNTEWSVYGHVFEAGVTDVAGQGVGVEGAVGIGRAGEAIDNWLWTTAVFNADVDASNDEYRVTWNTPSAPGAYAYAFRFRLNHGPWTLADLDGTDNGFALEDAGQLTVTSPPVPAVDWCRLEQPTSIRLAPDETSANVSGRVYEVGITDGNDPTGITGELGWGPSDTMPDAGGWTWGPALFQAHVGNNDEYGATFDAPGIDGAYDFAFRFRLDNGADWLYCDLDGSAENGYSVDQAGTLLVVTPTIGWGVIRPAELTWEDGTSPLGGEVEVFADGVTNHDGGDARLTVEVGYGSVGTDPSVSLTGWTFFAATYDRDSHGPTSNDNDVFLFDLPALPVGDSVYAGRASLDAGAHWTFLDANPDNEVFDAAHCGVAHVLGPEVDWAKTQASDPGAPPDQVSVTPGFPVPANVRVWEDGVTPGAGAGAGLEVEVGLGDQGSDPSGWTFTPATYIRSVDGETGSPLADDLFQWWGTAPGSAGIYDMAARARLNGGPWLYADASGSTSTGDPFASTEAFHVTVAEPPVEGAVTDPGAKWCRLQWADFFAGREGEPRDQVMLEPITVGPGEAWGAVYGRVYWEAPGTTVVTGPSGTGPTPVGQVGFGVDNSDPTLGGWTWLTVSAFNKWDGNNDEQWALPLAPAVVGTYGWAFRFSLDDGATWLYCDVDGATANAEYTPAQAGALIVQ